jgi:hypothetical protein
MALGYWHFTVLLLLSDNGFKGSEIDAMQLPYSKKEYPRERWFQKHTIDLELVEAALDDGLYANCH